VFELDLPDGTQRMYLVRGDAVRKLVVSHAAIDQVYAALGTAVPLPTEA
jgi:hypothetical protein